MGSKEKHGEQYLLQIESNLSFFFCTNVYPYLKGHISF